MSQLFYSKSVPGNELYEQLSNNPKFKEFKQHCEELWKEFAPYADRNFVEEFAINIHPRYWEMCLGVQLLRLGFTLEPKHTDEGPDICIRKEGTTIWIEAISVDKGSGPDAVPSYGDHNRFDPVPEVKVILRFTNALSKKWIAYNNYLDKGIISENDCYIIAINSHNIEMELFDGPLQNVIKAVYPIGNLIWHLNLEKMEVESEEYLARYKIIKHYGAEVSINFFLNPDNAGISGVLYSDAYLFNQYKVPGEEFLFIHNLVAKIKMENGWLGIGIDCYVEDDELFMRKIL